MTTQRKHPLVESYRRSLAEARREQYDLPDVRGKDVPELVKELWASIKEDRQEVQRLREGILGLVCPVCCGTGAVDDWLDCTACEATGVNRTKLSGRGALGKRLLKLVYPDVVFKLIPADRRDQDRAGHGRDTETKRKGNE